MPLLNLVSGASTRAFGFLFGKSNVTSANDNFNRTTSGSLDTSSSGALWNAIRGVWSANGTKGTSADTPTNYPVASITMAGNDNTLKADVTMGTGLAFWVSGSGDWWACVPYSYSASESYNSCVSNACCTTTNTCTYNACCSMSANTCVSNACCSMSANTCVSNSCCTGSPAYYSCSAYSSCCGGFGAYAAGASCYSELDASYVGAGSYVASTCVSNSCCTGSPPACISNSCCTGSPASCIASSCCTGSPSECVSNSCCTGSPTDTRTRYYWVLRIMKAIAGVFSTVTEASIANSLANTDQILSVSAVTSGDALTAKAYSDTGAVTQIGSTISIPSTGATKAKGVGIIKIDSANHQGSTIDNFSAN